MPHTNITQEDQVILTKSDKKILVKPAETVQEFCLKVLPPGTEPDPVEEEPKKGAKKK